MGWRRPSDLRMYAVVVIVLLLFAMATCVVTWQAQVHDEGELTAISLEEYYGFGDVLENGTYAAGIETRMHLRGDGLRLGGPMNGTALRDWQVDWKRYAKHGYRQTGETPVIRNQLYLENPKDPLIRRYIDELEHLDEAHIRHKRAKGTGQKRKRILSTLKKVGVGLSGRGWGITSAYTNKWRIYHKYLAQARDGVMPGDNLKMCEVGMLAGHSTVLFLSIAPNSVVQVFDYIQPDTPWAPVAQKHLVTRYPGRVNISWGDSKVTLKEYANANPGGRCTFVSLDGDKSAPTLQSDLHFMYQLADESTVMVLDDMTPAVVRSGVPSLNPPEDIAGLLKKYSDPKAYPKDGSNALAYHIAKGELIFRECWDADIPNLPNFGVCAVSFNMGNPPKFPYTF